MVHYQIRKFMHDKRFGGSRMAILVGRESKPMAEWPEDWKKKLVKKYGPGEYTIVLSGAGTLNSVFRGWLR